MPSPSPESVSRKTSTSFDNSSDDHGPLQGTYYRDSDGNVITVVSPSTTGAPSDGEDGPEENEEVAVLTDNEGQGDVEGSTKRHPNRSMSTATITSSPPKPSATGAMVRTASNTSQASASTIINQGESSGDGKGDKVLSGDRGEIDVEKLADKLMQVLGP